MFKLRTSHTFNWPVKAEIPTDSKHETVEFEAEFKSISPDELAEMIDRDGLVPALSYVLVRFSGIEMVDDRDQPITDPEKAKAALLAHGFMTSAVSDAYAAGLAGRKAKN